MSSPRAQKIFEAMPDHLRKLGKYDINFREAMRWQGRISDANTDGLAGLDAAVIDMDSVLGSWSSGDRRVLVVAEPARDKNNTAALKTQSHAQGFFLDGSVRFHIYMETPATWVNDLAEFQRHVIHHLRGQMSAPVKLWLSDNGDEPTIQGLADASASETFTEAEWMLPYGMTYPGGV